MQARPVLIFSPAVTNFRDSDHYSSGNLLDRDGESHVNAYEFSTIEKPVVAARPSAAPPVQLDPMPRPMRQAAAPTKAVSTPSLRSGGSASSLRAADHEISSSRPSLTSSSRYPRPQRQQYHEHVPQTQVWVVHKQSDFKNWLGDPRCGLPNESVQTSTDLSFFITFNEVLSSYYVKNVTVDLVLIC